MRVMIRPLVAGASLQAKDTNLFYPWQDVSDAPLMGPVLPRLWAVYNPTLVEPIGAGLTLKSISSIFLLFDFTGRGPHTPPNTGCSRRTHGTP